MIIYGIKNCNSVKKALNHLNEKGIIYEFHDYKKSGISINKLQEWSENVGWETLLNRKGTTWRKLDEKQKESVLGKNEAIEIMNKYTSLIKRPIIEKDSKIVTIGYDEAEFEKKF